MERGLNADIFKAFHPSLDSVNIFSPEVDAVEFWNHSSSAPFGFLF